MTNKDIVPGDELLVYYGFQYIITLKIHLNDYYDVSERLRLAGLDLNNSTHRQWVSEAGCKLSDLRNPIDKWLPILYAKLSN